jgi:hypothetical protein
LLTAYMGSEPHHYGLRRFVGRPEVKANRRAPDATYVSQSRTNRRRIVRYIGLSRLQARAHRPWLPSHSSWPLCPPQVGFNRYAQSVVCSSNSLRFLTRSKKFICLTLISCHHQRPENLYGHTLVSPNCWLPPWDLGLFAEPKKQGARCRSAAQI